MRFGFHHHNHERGHDGCGSRGWQGMREDMRGAMGRVPMGGGFGGRFGFGGPDGWSEGRGGPRRRMFDGGELRLVLLRLIGDQPRHGYDLIRAIEERTGGAYAPSPGVVYPTLTMLGDMGQIEEQAGEGGNRKVFTTTEEGRRVLVEKEEEVSALMARLDAIGAMRERTDGASIRRAMHNLKNVLRNRLASEDVPAEILHEAVALIDEAARKIERL
jgi:DNA-binding PadR family transcriptional regulator